MNAISILRVSTKRQMEGESISVQREQNQKYCMEKGYTITKEFEFAESAGGKHKRKEFEEVLEYCAKNRKQIDVVVIWKVDRFSRGGLHDYYSLKQVLSTYDIALESSTETIEDSAMGEMMEGWLALNARFENRVRVDRTIGAEKRLAAQGYWVRPAPTGFVNTKALVNVDGEQKRRPVLQKTSDTKQWQLLCEGLQKQLTGVYTLSEVAKELREKGFVSRNGKPLYVQTWLKICRNPVYGGLLREEWTDYQFIKAKFDGAITPSQWHELQRVLDNGGKTPIVASRVQKNESFPLRRFLRCSCCDDPCRGYPSIGKKGKRYHYYDCKHAQCGFRVPTEETHKLYKTTLEKLTPDDGVLNVFRAIVEEAWEKKIESFQSESDGVSAELTELHEERSNVLTLLKQCADNPALVEQLKQDFSKVEQRISKAKEPQQKPALLQYEKSDVLDRCCSYLKTADELWKKSPVEAKYRFQYMTFPDGISYDCLQDKRTPKVSLVYAALRDIESGDLTMAARRGIEPLLPG